MRGSRRYLMKLVFMRRHTMTRLRRLLLISALAALSITSTVAVQAVETPHEAALLTLINNARSQQGLSELSIHPDLVANARGHADAMAGRATLFHNPNFGDAATGWTALGENVGFGKKVDDIFAAFLASPSHRANILGDYNYAGVGVTVDSRGKLWVTVVFMQGPADATSAPQPISVTPAAITYTGDPADYPVIGLNTAHINEQIENYL